MSQRKSCFPRYVVFIKENKNGASNSFVCCDQMSSLQGAFAVKHYRHFPPYSCHWAEFWSLHADRFGHSLFIRDTIEKGLWDRWTDKQADKQTDRLVNSRRAAIEICHCLMLQPQLFGGSFKSHYTNCCFMTREPGANCSQSGMDYGLIVPIDRHMNTHREGGGCLGTNLHKLKSIN